MISRYFSRKFILTIFISGLSIGAPIIYKNIGVSDNITLAVLVILGGIGTAYGFLNVKDSLNAK